MPNLVVTEQGGYHHCFYINYQNKPVAYLSCILGKDLLELCDIEVREAYRGRKYSKKIIEAAQTYFGLPMVHTGSYTPLGLERISKYFRDANNIHDPVHLFRPMNFVDDWSNMSIL